MSIYHNNMCAQQLCFCTEGRKMSGDLSVEKSAQNLDALEDLLLQRYFYCKITIVVTCFHLAPKCSKLEICLTRGDNMNTRLDLLLAHRV